MSIKKIASLLILAVLPPLSGCAHRAVDDAPRSVAQDAAELDFRDFYQSPVGPYGLEPTDKLLRLAGKRVRIQGYMVKEEEPVPGLFMLASLPVNIPEKEDWPSDDLPGATIYVHMPREDVDRILAHRDGLWDLAGTLQLGAKEEANGRVSYVRLLLDQPAVPMAAKPGAERQYASGPR